MTDKQYADMTTIMQFGRIFAEQIKKCMEHTGLMDQRFSFDLRVSPNPPDVEGDNYCKVSLDKSISEVGKYQWKKSAMEQWKDDNNGWRIGNDPKAEEGSIPATVHYCEREKILDMEGMGKTGTKPYPPDGFWVSSHYYPTDVDGGM